MSGVVDAKAAWIERVFGIAVPTPGGATAPPPGAPPPSWGEARANWQAASEAVDRQIAALQSVLRQSGDDALEAIAEFGLNGVTGDHRVRLAAALMEVGNGDAATMHTSGPELLKVVEEFRTYLDSSEAVEVVDDNPFGVSVAIRGTLVPALRQLAAAVAAVGHG